MANWLRYPYGKKPLSDYTLHKKTKDELIQIIRDYEHNYAELYESNERGIAYAERKFKMLDATFLLKRLTARGVDGKPYLKSSDEVGWVDPVSRLAVLEDIVEEARRAE